MRDTYFEIFIKEFGEATTSRYVAPEEIDKWQGILPNKLLTHWKNEGWSSYQDGLFSLVNPSLYQDVVLHWLEDTPLAEIDNFHVIAISGLGVLYLWGEKYGFICRILTRHAIIEILAEIEAASEVEGNFQINRIFQTLKINNLDNNNIFNELVIKQHKLGDNEIFCFEPMIIKEESHMVHRGKKTYAIDYLLRVRELVRPYIRYVKYE